MRILGLLIALGLCAPTIAQACGNEVHLSTRQETRGVAKAEKLLHARKYTRALKTLEYMYGYALSSSRAFDASGDPTLWGKAERLSAIAQVRMGGRRRGSKRHKARQRRWALGILKRAHAQAPDDPAATGQYAEALALKGDGAAALKLLEPLAQADLITDPVTWKLLARLRGEAGDAKGRDAARVRCQAMAGDDKAFCTAPRG